ncbi:hypothetical protein BC937DRAFT_90983 [Endogone sp. FLAS-F59071]|nr:hypothetical protein BC937DRAFT_90983 [Endogone sp. FLAS-F59071]|eukprot:RUS16628.1 hypothetical protein BC937DRAFT_90983 [Endogone sp. FLAS-F59071]
MCTPSPSNLESPHSPSKIAWSVSPGSSLVRSQSPSPSPFEIPKTPMMMNKTIDWLTGLGHSPKKPRSLRMFVATQGPVDVSVHVLVPFEEMVSFNTLMESIKQAKCPFYIGHFQSGKTSALRYLAQIKPA